MESYYKTLRNIVCRKKDDINFKWYISRMIFRWAKDDSLELWEFAFLTKKAFNYLNKYKKS